MDAFTVPATADIRHAYALAIALAAATSHTHDLVHTAAYGTAVARFDRWFARQMELATQAERARNAKARPAETEISDIEASAMRLIAALVRSYGEPDDDTEGGTQMYVWDDMLSDTGKITITPDPIRHRTVIRVSE